MFWGTLCTKWNKVVLALQSSEKRRECAEFMSDYN